MSRIHYMWRMAIGAFLAIALIYLWTGLLKPPGKGDHFVRLPRDLHGNLLPVRIGHDPGRKPGRIAIGVMQYTVIPDLLPSSSGLSVRDRFFAG